MKGTNSAASLLAFSAAFTGCSVSAEPATTYEQIEITAPSLASDELRKGQSVGEQRRRRLAKELEDRAAAEIKARGLSYITASDSIRDGATRKTIHYAASPDLIIGYTIPIAELAKAQGVKICRFEIRPPEITEKARRGSLSLASLSWPFPDCAAPNIDEEEFKQNQMELAKTGYEIFGTPADFDSVKATVIALSFHSKAGSFDADNALDLIFQTDDKIRWSHAMPLFRDAAVTGETNAGDRFFAFSDKRNSDFPRSICIVTGLDWDEFHTWEKSASAHPARQYCMETMKVQHREYMRELNKAAEKNPPTVR